MGSSETGLERLGRYEAGGGTISDLSVRIRQVHRIRILRHVICCQRNNQGLHFGETKRADWIFEGKRPFGRSLSKGIPDSMV